MMISGADSSVLSLGYLGFNGTIQAPTGDSAIRPDRAVKVISDTDGQKLSVGRRGFTELISAPTVYVTVSRHSTGMLPTGDD